MKIINQTKNTILAEEVIIADTPLKRMKGLLGKKDFKEKEALIIRPCSSIHTFFMRFSIDVLFVDSENKIIFMKSNIKPWWVSPVFWQVKYVIELPAGVLVESKTCEGDEIGLV